MTKFAVPASLFGLATDLINKDWQPVWCPQRQSGSFSPEAGCTGGADYPTILPQPKTAHKLAFRPPLDVLVLDVDHYENKRGMDTIDRAVAWLGELPATFRVTSRGPLNPSGRYLYRMPPDLVVTDSCLAQFGEDGKTGVEIVRTGHRFSWAAGDYHYKNDELIVCYDEFDDPCDMPFVADLPYLPERWAAYFRNPPVPQKHEAYTRPSDGADWWLSQADGSLGSDAELASFAYNMLLSRVPEEEIFNQWMRVARADNPGWDWERKDFDRHLGARAQYKADQILARQDKETEWAGGIAGGPDGLQKIADKQAAEYANKQAAIAEFTVQPSVPFNQDVYDTLAQLGGVYVAPDEEYESDFYQPAQVKNLTPLERVKASEQYQQLLWTEMTRTVAKRDAVKILDAATFEGYEDISSLPDPPVPTLLVVTGKDNVTTSVVGARTVTVLSGHRASGKTWVSAAWAAQVIRSGGHVIWVDFERQPHGLSQKLRALGISAHLVGRQLHYTSSVPDTNRLANDIREYGLPGTPVLVVVDAFRGLQNTLSPGTSANDGDAVEAVYLEYLNPVTEAGATVVLLDHLAKTGLGGTFGSERKESAADYVITVKQECAFTKTVAGFSSLVVSKDRYGVVAAGTPAGYLWMPGDGSKSGKSVDQYPNSPEIRNWSPMEAADEAAADLSLKGMRETTLTVMVQEQPFRLSINKLATDAMEGYPDLFPSESSTKRYIREMVTAGKLDKDTGNGKLNVPAPVTPEVNEGKETVLSRLTEGEE